MQIELIDISLIVIQDDRRVVDLLWAEAISNDMAKNGQMVPIEVLQTGERYRLISGAHRIEARKLLGDTTVLASIRQLSQFRDEAEITLREIAENMLRRGLSVLDRAVDVARWREVYETVHGAVKAGRKKNRGKSAPISEDEIEAASEAFATSFTLAAQEALGLNKDAIKRALRIASISRNVRAKLALRAIAENQSELIALAGESAERQEQIANLLLSNPPAVSNVASAIALIDRVEPATRPEAWERFSDKFSKLPDPAKRRFFQEHWNIVEEIIAERAGRRAA